MNVLVILVSLTVAVAQDCLLTCNERGNCAFGEADFSDHHVPDGTPYDFHQVTNINGMNVFVKAVLQVLNVIIHSRIAMMITTSVITVVSVSGVPSILLAKRFISVIVARLRKTESSMWDLIVSRHLRWTIPENRAPLLQYDGSAPDEYCLNDGICAEGGSDGPGGSDICQCPSTHTGRHCQLVSETIPTDSCFKFCLSGNNLVKLEDESLLRMVDLKLGDAVLVDNGGYEKVYAIGHYEESSSTTYIVVNNRLEISPQHLIAVDGRGSIPAVALSVGDLIRTGSNGKTETVISIGSKTAKGLLAPFTPSGTSVVEGMVASSFESMQRDSAELTVGSFATGLSWHWIAHAFEAPRRLLCTQFTEWCSEETYSSVNGMSTSMMLPFDFASWLLQQHPVVVALVCLPLMLLRGLSMGLELLLSDGPTTPAACLVLAAIVVCARSAKNLKHLSV